MRTQQRPGPTHAIRIPVGPSDSALLADVPILRTRLVEFIKTRTPGVIITPVQDKWGEFTFKPGCALTHAPSGFRIGGPFKDLRVARLIAGGLAGVTDWNRHDMTDWRTVVMRVRHALEESPELLQWLADLNSWREGPRQ